MHIPTFLNCIFCNMGCICSKGAAPDQSENGGGIQTSRDSAKNSRRVSASSRRDEVAVDVNVTTVPQPQPQPRNGVSGPPLFDRGGKKSASVNHWPTVDIGGNDDEPMVSKIVSIPHGVRGEHVSAGWPAWLSSVAGEAIQGWVPRRADSFERLDKIGQGTYSSVYKARDLETGKIVALKKVRFVNMDPESVRFMAREIHIMRKLDHPNVLKLEALVTSRMSGSLYLVFEYMEHDLAGLAALSGVRFTESQIKCYMKQLLCGLEHCHSRGVLHRDIKGSNLLVDEKGILRIADFGLATHFHPDQKEPMTSRVVTLWYRPPELLLGATEYGVAVDLWSTGCIIAELFAGKPIMPGRTEVEQLHKIFKLCGSPSDDYWKKSKLPNATIFKPHHSYRRRLSETYKEFPSSSMALLDVLLAIEPENRGSASSALTSEFFSTEPHACSPSSLPKYPPSKELDAKRLNEEAKRQKAAAAKEHGSSKDSKAMSGKVTKREVSLQKQPGQSNPKSISEKFNLEEDRGSGFLIEPSKVHTESRSSRDKKLKTDENLVRSREAFGSADNHGSRSSHPSWPTHPTNTNLNTLDHVDTSEKREWNRHFVDGPASSHKQSERMSAKDSTTGYRPKKNRIHYSGPLMPPGGNMEDMLKEHERQIQNAVRKARLDKVK